MHHDVTGCFQHYTKGFDPAPKTAMESHFGSKQAECLLTIKTEKIKDMVVYATVKCRMIRDDPGTLRLGCVLSGYQFLYKKYCSKNKMLCWATHFTKQRVWFITFFHSFHSHMWGGRAVSKHHPLAIRLSQIATSKERESRWMMCTALFSFTTLLMHQLSLAFPWHTCIIRLPSCNVIHLDSMFFPHLLKVDLK